MNKRQININFNGPINHTGYGIASFNILKELFKNHNITYFPKGQPSVDNQKDYDLVMSLLSQSKTNFDINAPCLKIWHQFDLAEHVGRGRYFAYPFFELDTFSVQEKQHMGVPDHLFVTSKWAQDVIAQNNISTSTSVVPLGVDLNIFNVSNYGMKNHNKYAFLNIGKWEVRKGHDILLDIFQSAFPKEQDVELWIVASEHTNNYSSPEQLTEWKKKYSVDPRIKISTGVETQHDIAKIISQASCGIFMSRAEGWNLELLECMAMNKPVIATKFSAHTEFCDKNNSFLVDIDCIEKAIDGKAFTGQGHWAKIGQNQIDQCIEYMRLLYNGRIDNNLSGLETAKLLSWENSAEQIVRCM